MFISFGQNIFSSDGFIKITYIVCQNRKTEVGRERQIQPSKRPFYGVFVLS